MLLTKTYLSKHSKQSNKNRILWIPRTFSRSKITHLPNVSRYRDLLPSNNSCKILQKSSKPISPVLGASYFVNFSRKTLLLTLQLIFEQNFFNSAKPMVPSLPVL